MANDAKKDAAGNALRPAAFLDRDGVLNEDNGYVTRPGQLILLPGVQEACRRIAAAGYRLVIVTNQGGIALGLYSEDGYQEISARLTAQFSAAGVAFDGIYHAPSHPNVPHKYAEKQDWRKPAPGMLLAAARDLRLDIARSFMVGDKETDMQAAAAAGVPQGFWVGEDAKTPLPGVTLCRNLPQVADIIGGR